MRNVFLTVLSAGMLTCLPASVQAADASAIALSAKADSAAKILQHRDRRYHDRDDRRDRYDRRDRHDHYRDRSDRNIRGHDYRYGRDRPHRVAQPYPFHRARYRDCWREQVRGVYRTRPAILSVQVCSDRRGVRLVVRGSERLVRYDRYNSRHPRGRW
mgnify:CR=1 FL=1